MKKAKQHTVYKNNKGIRVPGVTTITGVMDKPALVPWANKIGLQGIVVGKYVDELASVGKLAHYIVEVHVKNIINKTNEKPDLGDYTPNQLNLAENGAIKFFNWENEHEVEYIASEMALISEQHQYGGMLDIYAKVDGKYTLLDLKTCKGIYNDHYTQVAGGYKGLLTENGHPVDDTRILRIGRDESEGFDDIRIPNQDLHRKRFLICKKLYDINKKLRW